MELAPLFSKARPDSVTKKFLFSTLGAPNQVQKFSKGYPDNRNYVEYIYYIYRDDCPKTRVVAAAIGFVFDENETYLVRIEDHDYDG